MGIEFNICQIFDIADELERNRADFFRKASNKFSDKKIKETLIEIADLDNYNAEAFAHIKEGFSSSDCPLTVFDPDNIDHLYLKAMADDHICNFDACKNMVGNETLEEILRMALRMEKDALAFYTGLENFVARNNVKNIDLIIREKTKHIGVIVKKLNELKKSFRKK